MTAAAIDWHRDAMRLMRNRDWPNALLQLDRALEVSPGVPQWLLSRAQILLALGHRREACESAATALGRAAKDALLLDSIGSFFSLVGDQHQALDAFERAATLAPDNAHILFNRATVRRFLGELAAAESDYDHVIALRPEDFEAYKNRSDLRTQTADNNHIPELERLVARDFADWRGEVQARHALAKEYEDVGEYGKSFEQLRAGAKKRRDHLRYDVATDVATVAWIIEAFPAGPPAPQPAAPQPAAPIFIVGMPRSGTTLVDRILSSHSQVTSAGELNDFALALVARVRHESGLRELPRRELVARSAHIDFPALGREYRERARAVAGEGRFTDKMPLNYLYCGLIRRALPDAKIVHLTRSPMAAGYAMYKTLFKDGYPFSYDLSEIAQYYAAYRRLMDHWTATMPGAIHAVSYESLVANQLGETRKLLEYCGLEWQDACAQFHRNPYATTTASAAQVRRPIYDSSVTQWRRYVPQLAELAEALTRAGVEMEAPDVGARM